VSLWEKGNVATKSNVVIVANLFYRGYKARAQFGCAQTQYWKLVKSFNYKKEISDEKT